MEAPLPPCFHVRNRGPKSMVSSDWPAASTASNCSFSSPQVTLVVGPNKVLMTAHKATLCQWSYFRVALLGNFKEATDQSIKLPEDRPEIVQALLEFMYSGDYVFRPPFGQALKCTKRLNGSSMCPCENFIMHGTLTTEPTTANSRECLVCEHTVNDHHAGANSLSMTPEQELVKMKFHARVYFLADKLGVSKLQKLAMDRVYGPGEMLNVGTSKTNDLAVGKLIYLNTSPEDKRLRKRALERTVHVLLTVNSVTPAVQGSVQGFGQGFGFGSSSSQDPYSGGFDPAPRLATPPGGDMTDELLEELVAQDPQFAFDIIKCIARNGAPKQKYH